MTPIEKRPPSDLRCQIYTKLSADSMGALSRCVNRGTHWERWAGCLCPDPDGEVCEDDFYSWECESSHTTTEDGT